jgi:hypothetical protein
MQGIDLCKLMEWWDYCDQLAKHFRRVREYAYRGVLRRAPQDTLYVYELIELLNHVISALEIPCGPIPGQPKTIQDRVRWCEYQKRCKYVGVWSHAALAVYEADVVSLRIFSRAVLGKDEHWPYYLSRALVENHLRGWRDWRNSKDPQAYIARVARAIAEAEAKSAAPLENVPLDEIINTPAESAELGVTVEPVHSFEALKDETRRRGDLEVLAYIEGLEARTHLGFKAAHREIRKQMGWDKFEASKIRGRFLRLRDAAAEYVTHGPISDASRTVVFEPFYEGEKGRWHGDWRHK